MNPLTMDAPGSVELGGQALRRHNTPDAPQPGAEHRAGHEELPPGNPTRQLSSAGENKHR